MTSIAATSRAKAWIREEIQALSAYPVHNSEGLIKLDAMENPYPWPESMQQEWLAHLAEVSLNRYPDAHAHSLKQCLRRQLDIPPGMRILLGNGSDELIQIIQLCMTGPERVILAPAPSFVMYEMVARFVGARFVGVPLNPDFSLNLDVMLNAVRQHDPAVVFLAYPNNPSGNLFGREEMDAIIRAANGLVVVDEAYQIFSGASYYDQLAEFDNLVVMRTLSKLGLAGLRLGFLVGAQDWLGEFEKARMPYNVSALTQYTAEFALNRLDIFQQQAARIIAERDRLHAALSSRPGFTVFDSRTNFILFRIDVARIQELFDRLVALGILVKVFPASAPGLKNCMRVSVGTAEENEAFLAGIDQCLA